jgi:hypothetical protein
MSSPAPWNDFRTKLQAATLIAADRIAWPNEPFANPEPPDLWLTVECTGDVLEPVELGPRAVWQEEGRAYVHILTPAGWGTDAARTLAKQIATVYRGLPAADVQYLGASIGSGEAADVDGAWWRITVAIDWRYQDIPA